MRQGLSDLLFLACHFSIDKYTIMLTPDQLSIFLPAAFIVAISPGANNILSLTHGAMVGFYPTMFSLTGRFVAFLMMLVLVAAGLGMVIATSENTLIILKWFGVCYLAYISFSMWFSEFHYKSVCLSYNFNRFSLAKKEFIVAITNPKAILLFTAFLPQFVSPNRSYFYQLLILGCIYIAVEFFTACIYAASGSIFGSLGSSKSRDRIVSRIGSILMMGAALILAIL